jgi:hypothetical protein
VVNLETQILKSISNDVNVVAFTKDNILTLTPHEHSTKTNIETLKVELEILTEWTKSTGPLPFLVDARYIKQMSTKERIYIQNKVPIFASQFAVLITGGLSTFFFNLLAHLNSPQIPMKAFSDPRKANTWLKNND